MKNKKDTLTARKLDDLVKSALKVQKNAYAPYSKFHVGAAIISESGAVYAGANCETMNYKSSCAERSAITAMVAAGDRKIRAIAIIGPEKVDGITPCGSCRQDIREFSDGNTVIYCAAKGGKHGRLYNMEGLLPDSVGPDTLKKAAAKKKKK